MIDKLKKTLQDATDMLREQASALGEGAKEKSYQLIEDWLKIFPKLEAAGLSITSFGLSIALNPALEVELTGSHADFTPERIKQLIQENRSSTALVSVINTIKMTYAFHDKIKAERPEPLLVKIRIRLSPEIQVFIGQPLLQ